MVLHIQWRARDVLRVNKDIFILGLHTYMSGQKAEERREQNRGGWCTMCF